MLNCSNYCYVGPTIGYRILETGLGCDGRDSQSEHPCPALKSMVVCFLSPFLSLSLSTLHRVPRSTWADIGGRPLPTSSTVAAMMKGAPSGGPSETMVCLLFCHVLTC